MSETSISTFKERFTKRIVAVRCVPGDDDMTLSLEVDLKVRQLNRAKQDPVGKTLNRILLSVVREKVPRALRKRLSSASSDSGSSLDRGPDIRIMKVMPPPAGHATIVDYGERNIELLPFVAASLDSGSNGIDLVHGHTTMNNGVTYVEPKHAMTMEQVSGQTSNMEAWQAGNVLLIGDVELAIVVNPPAVVKLALPDNIMVGFPVFPLVKYEFGSSKYSKFTWYKMATPPSGIDLTTKEFLERELTWDLIGEGFTFTPDVSLIRYKLKCECLPGNEAQLGPFMESAVSDSVVSAGAGYTLADARALYTQKCICEPNRIRIVSYNILADVFADNEFARSNFFPYCPSYAIDFYYRRQLILKELFQYNADIICLQECELKMFESYLKPAFEASGYHGYLCLKLGEMPEGEALFVRDGKFGHVQDCSISVRDALDLPCNAALHSILAYFPEYLADLRKRTAVAQVHLLRERTDEMRYICVINTHLYYKADAADIRLLQIAVICNYVSSVLGEVNDVISVVLCGDLNSTEGTPVLEYLCGREITEEHIVWELPRSSAAGLRASLLNPLELTNVSGYPPFTNYTPNFQETLDYIFSSKNTFKVTSIVPLPSANEIEVYVGLPNIVAPSDHLALVVELDWILE